MPEEQRPAGPEVAAQSASDVPTPAQLLRAVGYLTLVPVPTHAREPLGRAALFFPLVGLAVGAVLVGCDWVLAGGPLVLRSAVVAVVLASVDRGRQVRELAGAVASLGAGSDAPRALERMRQPSTAMTSAVGAAYVAMTAVCVWALAAPRFWGLLLAPMLGRWSMVVCAYSSRVPRGCASELARPRGVAFREFAWASVFTLAVTFGVTEAVGILIAVCVAAFTVGMRLLWHRRLDGVTDAIIGATGAMAEVLSLGLFALL